MTNRKYITIILVILVVLIIAQVVKAKATQSPASEWTVRLVTFQSVSAETLTYPNDKWQRLWYGWGSGKDDFSKFLLNAPSESSEQFVNDWKKDDVANIKEDNIKFKSSKTIYIPVAKDYKITVGSDDGIKLWVDDVDDEDAPKIDKWSNRGYGTDSVNVFLTKGDHKFRIDYYENTGDAKVSFAYEEINVRFPPCPNVAPSPTETSWNVKGDCWSTPRKTAKDGLVGTTRNAFPSKPSHAATYSVSDGWEIPNGKWKITATMDLIIASVESHGREIVFQDNSYANIKRVTFDVSLDGGSIGSGTSSPGPSVKGDGTIAASKDMTLIKITRDVDCSTSTCEIVMDRSFDYEGYAFGQPLGGGGDYHYGQITADVDVKLEKRSTCKSTCSSAKDLGSLNSYGNSLSANTCKMSSSNRDDIFKFTLSKPGRVVVSLDGPDICNWDFWIRKTYCPTSGNNEFRSPTYVSCDSSVTSPEILDAGTYYIDVHRNSGGDDNYGNIKVELLECTDTADCNSKASCADNRFYLLPKTCSTTSNTCVNVVGGNVASDGYAYCGSASSDIAANCGIQSCGGKTYYCTNDGSTKRWRLTPPAEVCGDDIDNDCDNNFGVHDEDPSTGVDADDSGIVCCSSTDCTGTNKACDTSGTANKCVECLGDTDCTDSSKPKCDIPNKKCVECLQATDCKGTDGTYNTYCPKDSLVANYVLPTCDSAHICHCEDTCIGNSQCAPDFCCTGERFPGPNKPLVSSKCVSIGDKENPWLCT